MSDKLKPCPFCGSEDVGIIGNSPAYVYCRTCGAHTDRFLMKSNAKTQWNRRVSDWIKTSERLPEIEIDVLVVSNNGNVCLGFMGLFENNGLAWVIPEEALYGLRRIYKPEKFPYWMPLPEPPEVEE